MRAKAWALVLLVIYMAQIFGNYVNPVGIEAIGWKFYIYYCVWVTMIFSTVYFCFVETQGPTLEELALIFDDAPSEKREADLVKVAYGESVPHGGKDLVQVEHLES